MTALDVGAFCHSLQAGVRSDERTQAVTPSLVPPTNPASGPSRVFATRLPAGEIQAAEYGTGSRTVVLLHGLSGSGRWWARNVTELSRDFRVLVPDLIGFGRSRTPGRVPPIGDVADLLLAWMQALELPPLELVGHSMGGQISIHLAIRAPERFAHLVLADASGIPRPFSPQALARFAAEVAPPWRWGDPTFLRVIVGDAWTAGPRALLQAMQNILRDDVRPLLPRITTPTLIIWGERDTLVPLEHARELRERIPGARLAILRGAAHNSMVDRPADFNRLLIRFLEGEQVGQ
jgi:pimeloyl-ACP methyl ester carboxylesterase